MNSKKRLLQSVILLSDLLTLTCAYVIAFYVRFYFLNDGIIGGDYRMLYFVVLILYLLIFFLFSQLTNIGFSGDIRCLTRNYFYLGACVFAFLYIMKSGVSYSRLQMFLFLIIGLMLSAMTRAFARFLFVKRNLHDSVMEQMVLITSFEGAKECLKTMKTNEHLYCQITGICVLDGDYVGQTINGIPVIAGQKDMLDVIEKESLDSVMLCNTDFTLTELGSLIGQLQAMGIKTHVKIEEANLALGFQHYDEVGNYSVMTYTPEERDTSMNVVRRMADVFVGLIGSLFVIVTLPLCCLLLKRLHKPLLISYIRVGRNVRRFRLFCYRIDEQDVIGKCFMLTGMQCLPMFFNLLNGDITLFGAKAPSLPEFMTYTREQRKALSQKPGMLATWVAGRLFDEKEQQQECAHWEEEHTNLFAGKEAEIVFVKFSFMQKLYHGLKRILDIFISLAGILISSPLWLLICIMIYLSDGHSPLYAQMRVGKHGRKIQIYKFRSMHYQAGDLERLLTPEQLMQYRKEFKLDDDPRVTAIGRVLRRTSLDELPQLLNVLLGDIALIGPRPIVADETKHYDGQLDRLLSLKPGLTGYWQAYARNTAGYASGKRQQMELYYIEHESIGTDLKILAKTVGTVLSGKGAQ